MQSVMKALFGDNPFDGFDPALAEPDLQGWGSEHPIFARAIDAVRPRLIVEVGTWKGASAIHMAGLCRDRGLDTEVVCIDTWLGAASTLTHGVSESQPERLRSLQMKFGYPTLYYTFARNVVDAGMTDRITPIAQTSENAAKILRFYGFRPDIIYIDAAHESDPVYRDLMSYWPLLRPGGWLIGDDCRHPGVSKGVARFEAKTGLRAESGARKYCFRKDKNAE